MERHHYGFKVRNWPDGKRCTSVQMSMAYSSPQSQGRNCTMRGLRQSRTWYRERRTLCSNLQGLEENNGARQRSVKGASAPRGGSPWKGPDPRMVCTDSGFFGMLLSFFLWLQDYRLKAKRMRGILYELEAFPQKEAV